MSQTEVDIPFWDHVEELRKTFLQILFTIGISVLLCFYFHQPLFQLLIKPLQHTQQSNWEQTQLLRKRIVNTANTLQILTLPSSAQPVFPLEEGVIRQSKQAYAIPPKGHLDYLEPFVLVLSSPIEGFSTMIWLSFWVGLTLSSPMWIWLIFRFIAPALSKKSQKTVFFFFIFSILLFISGILLAFFFTVPLANHYFFSYNTEIGINLWNLSSYLEYSLILLLGNGLGFEISGILFFMIWLGHLSYECLQNYRRCAYVAIFVISALVTPPDIFSQILLAVPLMLLYEFSIFFAKYRNKIIMKSQLTLNTL